MPGGAGAPNYDPNSFQQNPFGANPAWVDAGNPQASTDVRSQAGMIFDPAGLTGQVFQPNQYAWQNRNPAQAYSGLMGANLAGSAQKPGDFSSYLAPWEKEAEKEYGAGAEEAKATQSQQSQAAAGAYAHRGVAASGMAGGAQMQVADNTQKNLNQLRSKLTSEAYTGAMGTRGQDINEYLGQLKMAQEFLQGGDPSQKSKNSLGAVGNIFGTIMGASGG